MPDVIPSAAAADTTTPGDAPAAPADEAAKQPTTPPTNPETTPEAPAATPGEQPKAEDGKEGDEQPGAGADGAGEAADGSAAEKEQNRLGYQMRQIRGNDTFVAKLRTNLNDNYVNAEGLTDEQARIRKLEADQYIKDVEGARTQLIVDNDKVAQEISLFNPNSKDFSKELLDRSLQRYSRDQLERDAEGEIIGYKIPLLDYMREEADAYTAGSASGKKADDTAAATMDAASDNPGGTSPATTTPKKTPFDEAFEAGFNSVK